MNNNNNFSNAKYKFEENLLKASHSKTFDEALKEWKLILKTVEPPDSKRLCICQRKVRNINYMYNIKNQNTIICGSKCCKKFCFTLNTLDNKTLLMILVKNLKKGDYENINNILLYCDEVKEQLISWFEEQIFYNSNDNTFLYSLLSDISNLIDEYGFDGLKPTQETLIRVIKYNNYLKQKKEEVKNKKKQLLNQLITYFEELQQNEYDVKRALFNMLSKYFQGLKQERENIKKEKKRKIDEIKINKNRLLNQLIKTYEIKHKIKKRTFMKETDENKKHIYWTCRFCNISKMFDDISCCEDSMIHYGVKI